ncbi:hypothetical protein RJ640_006609 [Escallonia rubra]|uniref:Uncharacterized protein n=1 Tax=Escallonia rubra TaxID=112253 RepID=A0AA88RLG9_9ASTE|nr:hypothetical protein RJ640_006609 [Escallonia rubra]
MANFNCFCALGGKRKKDKGEKESAHTLEHNKGIKTLQVRLEQATKSSETGEIKLSSFNVPVPFAIPGSSKCKVKVMNHESPVGGEFEEAAYEGEDEGDESLLMKRDCSDFDLQAHVADTNEGNDQFGDMGMNVYKSFDTQISDKFDGASENDIEEGVDMIDSGHVSDPGLRKVEFLASPKLKRSCSNLETRNVLKKMAGQFSKSLSESQSFEELQRLGGRMGKEVLAQNPGSPNSVMSHCSADKVMLKKHSSMQILPSRSRRLWWKLFLWSHRNLHEPRVARKQPLVIKPLLNLQGGYSSDTLEPNRGIELRSPPSSSGKLSKKRSNKDEDRSWNDLDGVSGLWPQNQWVAFPPESSSLTRVDEWVKELSTQLPFPVDYEGHVDNEFLYAPSPDTGRSPAISTVDLNRHQNLNLPEEVLHANSVIQSLNSSSTVAHISGMGLKVIPAISRFSSLQSVNLSGNFIVHIGPGSLPKGLHSLSLSRNKISTIEGLRELTRLRVLDLSYNRISRVGQGLSNCTLIKELYLAGNKISDVEGLHRLLKLTILDLSFNKITTTKALGQLVANYNSLLALNLLGNPIQNNISDDQLRKALCGLLPKLAYLNKQAVTQQKAREVSTDSITKAALGNSVFGARRRAVKRASQGGSSSFSGQRSNANVAQKSRHKLKCRTHQSSALKMRP